MKRYLHVIWFACLWKIGHFLYFQKQPKRCAPKTKKVFEIYLQRSRVWNFTKVQISLQVQISSTS